MGRINKEQRREKIRKKEKEGTVRRQTTVQ
jgi:hypothetical protein